MSQALHEGASLPGALTNCLPEGQSDVGAGSSARSQADRVKAIVVEHYSCLWRSLRRLGVREADVEDVAQKCLWVVARRIDDVVPGKERAFLLGVGLRVAKAARRLAIRNAGEVDDEVLLAELPASGPDLGEQLDDRRARVLLDTLLGSLPLDLREVFVLYEIEELTMAEIASALGIPSGTVASRLRRAREVFDELSRRAQRQARRKEGLR